MIGKIKKILKEKPILTSFVILLCVFIPFMFLFQYHKPISLNNVEDFNEIKKIINTQHGDCQIKKIELKENIVYKNYIDSIINFSEKIETIDDINWYTNTVIYTILQNDTILSEWVTIFEIKESFLKKNVGKHILTFQN